MSAKSMSDTIDSASDILFSSTRTGEFHSEGMHLVSDVASALDFFDFLSSLHATHLYDSVDELHRCGFSLGIRMNAHEIHDLNHDVMSIRREEMNLSLSLLGIRNDIFYLFPWCRILDSNACCKVGNGRNATIPYDVFYVNIIAQEPFFSAFAVDNSDESNFLDSEIIEERTVLTEWRISIVRIITRLLVIAEEDDNSVTY